MLVDFRYFERGASVARVGSVCAAGSDCSIASKESLVMNANQNQSNVASPAQVQGNNQAQSQTPVSTVPVQADVPEYTTEQTAFESNGVKGQLVRLETSGKGDKDGVVYWGIELRDWDVVELSEQKDSAGNVTRKAVAAQPLAVWTAVDTMVGHDIALDKLQSKLNQDCRVAQLDGGKDKFTMGEKLDRIKEYIANGFGAERGGVTTAAFNALKKQDTAKSELLAKMLTLSQEMFKPGTTPARMAQIAAEVNAIQTQVATLK